MQLLTMAILAAVSMGVSQETPTPKPEAPVAASEIKLKMLVKPTAAELTATLPARAANLTRPASVSLDCLITAAGSLEDCRVLNETPPGYGFGKAALLLSAKTSTYHLGIC
jgi:protein TonB